jgi:hypothetical protein
VLADLGPVDDVDTRAVGEGRVDDGAPVGERPLDPFGEFDDEVVEFRGLLEPDDRF